MDTKSPTKPKRGDIDWERIEVDFRAGIKTLRQIADEHGISHGAVNKRAKRDGWERDMSARLKPDGVAISTLSDDGMYRSGFIYVIYIETDNGRFYKIGMAVNPIERMKTHQCSNPFEVKIATVYMVENMRKEEMEMHDLFSEKRIRGEWFSLDEDDLAAISKRTVLV